MIGRPGGRRARFGLLALLGALLLIAGGCGPFVDQSNLQDHPEVPAGALGGASSVGEEFAPSCDALAAIDVQLAMYPTVPRQSADLVLSVAPADDPTRTLGDARFAETSITPNQWVEIDFPAVSQSRGRPFRLTARSSGTGASAVTVWATDHWTDPSARRLVNGQSVPGALVYRAYCDPPALAVARDTASAVVRDGLLWPGALALCVIPGLAVALWLDRDDDDPAGILGGAIGWSVLLAPIALVLATPLHLAGALGPGLLVIAVAVITLFGLNGIGSRDVALSGLKGRVPLSGLKGRSRDGALKCPTETSPGTSVPHPCSWLFSQRGESCLSSQRGPDASQSAFPSRQNPPITSESSAPRESQAAPIVVALIAAGLAIGVRAILAKDLVVPAWGDPVQHSYVAQLILQDGGVPSTYGALVPSQIFDYHFAFQALAAYAAALASASTATAVLVVGQVLDGLIALAAYRLARDLAGSAWAGAAAAVLVALVTVQPTYYVSWGRYPEVAGLAALPAAFAVTRRALGPKARRRDLLAAVIASAAMIVVHPRVAIFFAALVIAEAIVRPREPWSPGRSLRATIRLAGIGAAGMFLCGPWILRLWQAHYQQLAQAIPWAPISFPLDLAISGADRWVVILGLLGLALTFLRGSRLGPLVVIWGAIVFVAANPASFRLPVYLALDNGAVAIVVFLPSAVLVGELFETLTRLLRRDRWRPLARWALAGGLLAAGLSQTPPLLGIMNPDCILVRPADVGAIAWAKANTPPDARFLIEGFLWAPDHYMGSDAGYWLPVLAGRQVTLPPLFYRVGPAEEVEAVNHFAAATSQEAGDPDALAALARQAGAHYVFIGTRGGDFDPGRLVESGRFRVDYGAGGAWVLEVVGGDVGAARSTTETGITPTAVDSPSAANAAGLRSTTSG